jgi:hypothetical protein
MKKTTIILFSAALLSACSSGSTNGVQAIGQNHYIIGDLGAFTDFSASATKVRIHREAAQYCASQNKNMQIIHSSSRDSGYAQYATAELQFRCV